MKLRCLVLFCSLLALPFSLYSQDVINQDSLKIYEDERMRNYDQESGPVSTHVEITTSNNLNQAYYEFNFGVALLQLDQSSYFPFPGVSWLWGKKFHLSNSTFCDIEAGLALPSLFTGKIGLGISINKFEFTFGVRPWPLHLYFQPKLATTERGDWILSFEISPYSFSNKFESESMYSNGIINFGYRWNMKKK